MGHISEAKIKKLYFIRHSYMDLYTPKKVYPLYLFARAALTKKTPEIGLVKHQILILSLFGSLDVQDQ